MLILPKDEGRKLNSHMSWEVCKMEDIEINNTGYQK